MTSNSGHCTIALHQARAAQKSGAAIKLVFGVADVAKFKREREFEGLKFGLIHTAANFEFANTKDPAGNSIQISSRGLRQASLRVVGKGLLTVQRTLRIAPGLRAIRT